MRKLILELFNTGQITIDVAHKLLDKQEKNNYENKF